MQNRSTLRVLRFTNIMKVLCVGSITKDIFFPTSEGIVTDTPEDLLAQKKISFELGAKYHIDNRYETLGGVPVNVACGLAKLGLQASCYAPVGSDETGEWARKELEKLGVDAGLFQVIPDAYSDLSAIIVEKSGGDRTIFSNHSASVKFNIEKEKIINYDWIFIGDLSGNWKTNLDVILSAAEKNKISLVFNPRQKAIHDDVHKNIEAMSLCQVLFVNKDEAIEIVSAMSDGQQAMINGEINKEEYLLGEMKKTGAEIVLLTDGMRGAWGYDGKQMIHVPALLHSSAVDSTGAGDAFASGFLAAHLKGKNLGEALKWGIANSSSCVKEYGGQKGLLNEEQIEKVVQGEADVEKLKF